MKPRESLLILIILLAIIALGIWRAISISIAHPHLMDFKNQFVPLSPDPSDDVNIYVKTHISDLSPVKESLGGKFYVTDINIQESTGDVYYEDGHNAYKAHFSWSRDPGGEVQINSFVIY